MERRRRKLIKVEDQIQRSWPDISGNYPESWSALNLKRLFWIFDYCGPNVVIWIFRPKTCIPISFTVWWFGRANVLKRNAVSIIPARTLGTRMNLRSILDLKLNSWINRDSNTTKSVSEMLSGSILTTMAASNLQVCSLSSFCGGCDKTDCFHHSVTRDLCFLFVFRGQITQTMITRVRQTERTEIRLSDSSDILFIED